MLLLLLMMRRWAIMVAIVGAALIGLLVRAQAHPAGKFGLVVTVSGFQRAPDDARKIWLDLKIQNDSGLARVLRGISMPVDGQVRWTRGKHQVPARVARIDPGESWRLGNRFNLLEITLAEHAGVTAQTLYWITLDFGRDDVVDLRFTEASVLGTGQSFTDEGLWLSFDELLTLDE